MPTTARDEFPWDDLAARDEPRRLARRAEDNFRDLAQMLEETRKAREEESREKWKDAFWLEAELDISRRKEEEARRGMEEEAARRALDAEEMSKELEKVRAERDRLAKQVNRLREDAAAKGQGLPGGRGGGSRVVLVCLDSAVINVEAEFDLRWWGHGLEASGASLRGRVPCRNLADEARKESDGDTARNAEHILTESGFLSACGAHAGAIDALSGLRDQGCDVRLWVAGQTGRFESSAAEYMAWVREHLGLEWLARMVIARDAALIKACVFLAGRLPRTGRGAGGAPPEWTFVHVISTSKGQEGAAREWPKAGLNSDMPSWQDWRRVVLPLVRPSAASEPPSSAGSAHGSTGSSIADGQEHTPQAADLPSIHDSNQPFAGALKGPRERGAAERRVRGQARGQAREQATAAAQGAILEI